MSVAKKKSAARAKKPAAQERARSKRSAEVPAVKPDADRATRERTEDGFSGAAVENGEGATLHHVTPEMLDPPLETVEPDASASDAPPEEAARDAAGEGEPPPAPPEQWAIDINAETILEGVDLALLGVTAWSAKRRRVRMTPAELVNVAELRPAERVALKPCVEGVLPLLQHTGLEKLTPMHALGALALGVLWIAWRRDRIVGKVAAARSETPRAGPSPFGAAADAVPPGTEPVKDGFPPPFSPSAE